MYSAYLLFLNAMLKMRHAIVRTIPTVARTSMNTTRPVANVCVTAVGLPSGGIPSAGMYI